MLETLSWSRAKIVSPQELRAIVGPRPRTKRVIMCHGVFDVVHPGHIRHLLYAKSKADILVASVTADRHIDKGTRRPHVPQELRAANLAVFEMVDHVIIDDGADALANLALIEPDYFAKGFEYVQAGDNPSSRTAAEIEAVRRYGGEVIFTPGDVVYSSSKLIGLAPPDIRFAKLHALMERSGVTFDTLRRALEDMPRHIVHVVGDTIVDTITHANLIGASGKTPTMSVQVERIEHFVGGAAVVARHIRAAGAKVVFSTVLGRDEPGRLAAEELRAAGMALLRRVEPARPTTTKNAVVVGGYRLLKIDTADNRAISDATVDALKSNLTLPCDATVFSDFRHGIFNRASIPGLVKAIPTNRLRAADSQVASRWGNILDFQGFDLITPNEREARFATGDQDSGIRALALNLHAAARCKCLILKLGERGALTQAGDDSFVVDSFADHVADAVGAGDALLAYATLAMLASASNSVIATILGTFAAGIACERDGNAAVTAEDVAAKIDSTERQMA
jgi:rfaE bifunctional protein kinase chain/domain